MKLIIIGDSVMKGVCLSDKRQRYVLHDDSGFKLAAKERGVTIEKHCRLGATVDFGLAELQKTITGPCEDTTVLFGFGGNDSDYDWREIAEDPYREHICHTAPEDFVKIYGQTVDYAKSTGAAVAMVNLIPVTAMKYFLKISELVYYGNVIKWLGDVDRIARWQSHYNDLVTEIAQEHECTLIDLRTPFAEALKKSDILCSDGLHPTDEGHALIEKQLLGFIDRSRSAVAAATAE